MFKRNTKQKEEVIKFLENNKNKHLHVNDIQQGLENKVGLTTIYRILNNLNVEGLITKKPIENDQGFCYKYNNEKNCSDEHYHLICDKCDKVIHYENSKINKLCNSISNECDFKIRADKLTFYGICKNCKER